jgi:hypothetical protein
LTASGPAPIDDGPPGLGFHSGPKSMGSVTLDIAGLKSSLAHFVPFNVDELAKSSRMARPSMLPMPGESRSRDWLAQFVRIVGSLGRRRNKSIFPATKTR